MSSSLAEALGLPPGVRFDPTADELVEYYLLPRALGRPPAVPGVIIEEDADAATTSTDHPWKLLTRHGRTDDEEAYFFERVTGSDNAKDGGRQAQERRSCGGRWTWVGQRREPDEVLPLRGGGQATFGKYNLNLQRKKEPGRCKSGSMGWVMHEYTVVASPQCPFPVKICHVAFTGHGQKRRREPDDDDDGEGEAQVLEPPAAPPQQKHKHKRAATASSLTTTTTPDQEDLGEAPVQNNQDQQPFPNYYGARDGASSVADFWGSVDCFSQESPVLDAWCPGGAGSSRQEQEPVALDQVLAYGQEQLVNHAGMGSYVGPCTALLQASDLGSSQEFAQDHGCFTNQFQSYSQDQFLNVGSSGQEPSTGQPLNENQQLQMAQLLGGIRPPHCPETESAGAVAAYHEEHIQTKAPESLRLPTDQESCLTEQQQGNMDQDDDFFGEWGDLHSFCDTTGVPIDDDMAAGTLAGDGHGGGAGAC